MITSLLTMRCQHKSVPWSLHNCKFAAIFIADISISSYRKWFCTKSHMLAICCGFTSQVIKFAHGSLIWDSYFSCDKGTSDFTSDWTHKKGTTVSLDSECWCRGEIMTFHFAVFLLFLLINSSNCTGMFDNSFTVLYLKRLQQITAHPQGFAIV